jgi:hypothetical protein
MADPVERHPTNKKWVYGKDGSSKTVTRKEAEELYATGEWADHPDHWTDKEVPGAKPMVTEEAEAPEAVEAPEEEESAPTEAENDSQGDSEPDSDPHEGWSDAEVTDFTKAQMIAKAEDMGLDPVDTLNKTELLAVIQKNL